MARRVDETTEAAGAKAGAQVAPGKIVNLEHGYRPTEDEPFMNDRQREYFRRKLIAWKERSSAMRN